MALVLAGVAAAGASAWLAARPEPSAGAAGVTVGSSVVPPANAAASTAATASSAPRPAGEVVLRPDGLGVVAFGGVEQEAVQALRRRLGPWIERGSWPNGQTAFGTCTGAVRALRWGRLYALFTDGPTPYGQEGTWHLFAYQVATWKVFPVVPTGPDRPLAGCGE